MLSIFSSEYKIKIWRRLWIALATAQKELGIDISNEQITELIEYADNLDMSTANKYEEKLKHDVMAHIHAYGEQCKLARPIIHLGATSCYVVDNADLCIYANAFKSIKSKLITLIYEIKNFANQYSDTPIMGYTHFQPAQPTTLGKRASLWLYDLILDFDELNKFISSMKLLGSKGATGSQASFMELFNNNEVKVSKLDELITTSVNNMLNLDFKGAYTVTGQTYSRKIDSKIMNIFSGLAQSASKFANDLRLMQHLREVFEPFDINQVGSSAMPYKRNPVLAERMTGIARHIIINSLNPAFTSASQWFERTLDDSSNKRISMAEGFLAVDSILNLYTHIIKNLKVNDEQIRANLLDDLPFIATENILMSCVKRGGDRQDLHEKIRQFVSTALESKNKGEKLLELISNDEAFNITKEEIELQLNPHNYVGRSKSQVKNFINKEVEPILKEHKDLINKEHTQILI
jgi:adenylosuccinate lyase